MQLADVVNFSVYTAEKKWKFKYLEENLENVGCGLYTCEAAEYVLGECLWIDSLSCEKHTQAFHRKLIKIVTNMYFNNHCNRKAEKQFEEKVKHFKKMKRLKEEEEFL